MTTDNKKDITADLIRESRKKRFQLTQPRAQKTTANKQFKPQVPEGQNIMTYRNITISEQNEMFTFSLFHVVVECRIREFCNG